MTSLAETNLRNLPPPTPAISLDSAVPLTVERRIPYPDPQFAAPKGSGGRKPADPAHPHRPRAQVLYPNSAGLIAVACLRARADMGRYRLAPRVSRTWLKQHGVVCRQAYVSSSSRADLCRCPRYFMFRHRLGLVLPTYVPALEIGITWHRLVAELYQGAAPSNLGPIAAAQGTAIYERLRDQVNPAGLLPNGRTLDEQMRQVGQDLELAVAMAVVFVEHYPPEKLLQHYILVGTEHNVVIRLPGISVPLAGRLDLVLQDKATGAYWIPDHKTTNLDPAVRAATVQYEFQPQFYAYLLWLQLNAERVPADYAVIGGWWFNIMQKPTIRPRQTETREDYITRVHAWYRERTELTPDHPPFYQTSVRAGPCLLDESLLVQIHMTGLAASCYRLNLGRFHCNEAACFGRYGNAPCPYLQLCTHSSPADWPELIQAHYRQEFRDPHGTPEEST